MIHDAMMHWRGKNKNGENWILFFCVFLLFLVLCVFVCVEREKNEVMRNTVFFFVSNQI